MLSCLSCVLSLPLCPCLHAREHFFSDAVWTGWSQAFLACFLETLQPSSYSKWRISPQRWAGSTGALWQSLEQLPLHGRGAFSSLQSPERLTLILASAPTAAVLSRSFRSPARGPSAAPSLTPHLPSQCLSLLCPHSFSVPSTLSFPSTKFLSSHSPPCSVSFH